MSLHTYLKRRGATYYARMPVPLDLQTIIGKKELAKSLGTKDAREAKRLLNPVVRQWHDDFEEYRRRREMTPADLGDAVWQHYEAELEHDNAERLGRPTQADIDAATLEVFAKNERGEIADDPLAIFTASRQRQPPGRAQGVLQRHAARQREY